MIQPYFSCSKSRHVIQAGQSKYSIPLVRSLEWPYSSDDQNPFSETDQFSSVQSLSCVRLFATPWTIQSMEISRPEFWSEQSFPSPGDLPNPGIDPRSPALQADSFLSEPPGKPIPGLSHDETLIEDLNRLITSKEIEFIIKNLPTNKSPDRMAFTGEFYQTFKEFISNLLKLFRILD